SPAARVARVAACFRPYHDAIAGQLAGFTARTVVPAVISIHSFTPIMNGRERPWHVGILWDRDPRLAVPLIAGLAAADPRRVVGDTPPYPAPDPAAYWTRPPAGAAGLPHVGIEIRQALIDPPSGAAHGAEALASAFKPILAKPDLYRVERFP